jgi:hypothetical protein
MKENREKKIRANNMKDKKSIAEMISIS